MDENQDRAKCGNIPARKIQNVYCFINNTVANLSSDSGREGDCMREDECVRLNITIIPLDQTFFLILSYLHYTHPQSQGEYGIYLPQEEGTAWV